MTENSNNKQQGDGLSNSALGSPQPAFNKKWDLGTKHEANNTANRLQASHDVLETLKANKSIETIQWLNSLKTASASTATISEQSVENSTIGQAIQWLDKMFVQFELYAAQFNLNVRGTNLVVSCTRPIRRTNNSNGLYAEVTDDCLSYAGHIATQLWALVVRGCATKVEVFIIPAEMLLGFSVHSIDESGYKPLLVIESSLRENIIMWHIENTIITQEQIPALAKELFGDLIKVASGQASEFDLSAQQSTLSNNTKTPNTTPQAQSISLPALECIKPADQLLAIIDKDINQLIESGKNALQLENAAPFEQIKLLTEKLEILKKSLSITLANIHQIIDNTKK